VFLQEKAKAKGKITRKSESKRKNHKKWTCAESKENPKENFFF
jgi:hypothetical protein